MKISVNWLKQYINIDIEPDVLLKGLTALGIEVEEVEIQSKKLDKFVIGKVLEKKKHPNADKLSVCKVDAGTGEILNIVCGAPNVDAGQTVCVALIGAIIPIGEFEIKKAKLRGEPSEGMICSAKELNLGVDHTGIMVLEDRLPVGTPFAEYLGQNDIIIDISILPNKGDLLSHLGVSREIQALTGNKFTEPEVKYPDGKEINKYISVEIQNPEGCYRYCGTLIKNVKVKESPDWLKNYITAVGLRPINNVVDITNYVMLECGQPLHAFDYDMISGKKIIVKSAGKTKKFTTLDSRERVLREDVLLICDGEKPVALAGIMGGENSEISSSTSNVFIESAYFDPVLTRMSSRFLGLQTDSSYRFERGVDIERTLWASMRAALLIAELAEGEIVEGIIDEYPHRLEPRVVEMRLNRLNGITGIEFTKEQATQLLEKIDIKYIGESNNYLKFGIPQSRRDDLQREVDLIEEVLRLYGYDKIEYAIEDKIFFDTRDFYNKEFDFINTVRQYFKGRGFKEIISNSLIDKKVVSAFSENNLSLLNSSSDQMTELRTSLINGVIDVVKLNFEHNNNSLKMFEFGNCFNYDDKSDIIENRAFILVLAGEIDVESYDVKPRYFDLLDIKAEVKALLEKLHIENFKINHYNYTGNYEYIIDYTIENEIIAKIVKITDKYLKSIDIEKPVIICEIPSLVLLESAAQISQAGKDLFSLSNKELTFKEYSNYPPVVRDLSIVVDGNISEAEIEKVIFSSKTDGLLKKLKLYDIYIPADQTSGKKSYTYTMEFRADDRTLRNDEVNIYQQKIIENLAKKLKAELRS